MKGHELWEDIQRDDFKITDSLCECSISLEQTNDSNTLKRIRYFIELLEDCPDYMRPTSFVVHGLWDIPISSENADQILKERHEKLDTGCAYYNTEGDLV